jgi:hypothetical protein
MRHNGLLHQQERSGRQCEVGTWTPAEDNQLAKFGEDGAGPAFGFDRPRISTLLGVQAVELS